jgi:hypothetical protein
MSNQILDTIISLILGLGLLLALVWIGYVIAGLLMLAGLAEIQNYWAYFFIYLGIHMSCFSIVGIYIYINSIKGGL